jgi:hypothetical protein
LKDLFREACVEIENEYVRLGHAMGWRFLTSPRATLAHTTPIALITLNPGGSVERPDHARESSESGSAYIVEHWRRGKGPGDAPLQREVRILFSLLAAAHGAASSGDELLHRSLSAYFVPFRSPSFEALAFPDESLAFASRLWSRLFEHLDPKLVITIDRRTAHCVGRILGEKLDVTPSEQHFPTGWGEVTAEIRTFECGGARRSLLRLPHLSRFGVFTRSKSRQHMERVIRAATLTLR